MLFALRDSTGRSTTRGMTLEEPEMVFECGDPPRHEPGPLAQGDIQPTAAERPRMIARMEAGMPKLEDLR
ncbi:MAG: hypothetical protein GY913_23665 [Proteobacteria bacterium]|nr:hypothetical protein [Pseudomonadota bacterium]MCP4919912.1 hypothetical protein [Pseudomonadota bacterium]